MKAHTTPIVLTAALLAFTSTINAQSFQPYSLYDLLVDQGYTDTTDGYNPANWATSVSGEIPGSGGVTVTLTTTQGVFANSSIPGQVVWMFDDPAQDWAAYNEWNITFSGGTAQDIRFTLVDFDHYYGGTFNRPVYEGIHGLDYLGVPDILETTGANNNAQMSYGAAPTGIFNHFQLNPPFNTAIPSSAYAGATLHHATDVGNTNAGSAVAEWHNVNLEGITFTTTRTTALISAFNLEFGILAPAVPEPSGALLIGLAGTLTLLRRRRAA